MPADASLLVIDDDVGSSTYTSLALQQAGYSVRTAQGAVEGLLAIERQAPTLVISDLHMPGMGGLELLTCVKERWPGLPVLVMTVEEEVATVVQAIRRGAADYLIKPVSPSTLTAAAARALPPAAATMGELSRGEALEIRGQSAAVVRVRHLIALAARSDVNVVITGETGTGKELASRAIHRLSPLAGGPFIPHNCALTPPDMFDSEFFGHRQGAFTGAVRDREGILREADGGVLFLDELECLSLANQAKLLRVLDDGEVRPIGSARSRPVSVRFVAATNRSPEAMLASNEMRADLYYRLRGFQIDLPPLRDRPEDIPVLAEHFLKDRGTGLTSAAAQALMHCSWPGNVRQLRNVLRSASAVAGGHGIDVHHLDLTASGEPSNRAAAPPPSSPILTLEGAERAAITRALETHGWNLSRTAGALGIHRSTLHRKVNELGIDRRRA